MYHNKRANRSRFEPVKYDGVITGIYSDAQSRMLVEITIVVNGKERIIKKQQHQLGFECALKQKVVVEFVPNASGVYINVFTKR